LPSRAQKFFAYLPGLHRLASRKERARQRPTEQGESEGETFSRCLLQNQKTKMQKRKRRKAPQPSQDFSFKISLKTKAIFKCLFGENIKGIHIILNITIAQKVRTAQLHKK